MKKLLLTICVTLVSIAIIAQQSNLNIELHHEGVQKGYSTMSVNTAFTPSNTSAPSNIWYDDCSDANNWIFENTSSLNIDWRVEYDPNATPAGGTLTPMASATAANGYMFVSSDADGGTTDGDGTTIECTFTNATPIDLTAYPAVQLSFEHNFRWWKDTRIVEVSGDNGVTWNQVDEITNNAGYTYPDQSSDNPHMSVYDISAVAGGRPEVKVRFYYNDNDIWAWYWAVDDIAISELPDDNIQCFDEVMGGWWINYNNVANSLGQDYTFYPLSQASAQPYAYEAVVKNGGINQQYATLKVDVNNGSWTDASNVLTLQSGEQDTLGTTNLYTPSTTGLYEAKMWVEAQNQNAGYTYSDTITKVSQVTDYEYGKDYNSPNGYWRLNRVLPTAGSFEVSSTYYMYADEDLYSIKAHISDWSIPGAVVYGIIYEEDLTPNADPILFDQTDDYTIQAGDVNNWISLPFSSPVDLVAGTQYRIAIGAYQTFTDTVGIDMGGNGEFSSDGLYDKDDWYQNTTAPGPTWYTISDIPMLRMNFDPSSGISATNNVEQSVFSLYPNPTNGKFTIKLDKQGDYELNIINVLGQTVLNTTINDMSSTIDMSRLDRGVYTIELIKDGQIYSDKIILE